MIGYKNQDRDRHRCIRNPFVMCIIGHRVERMYRHNLISSLSIYRTLRPRSGHLRIVEGTDSRYKNIMPAMLSLKVTRTGNTQHSGSITIIMRVTQ